MWRWRRVHSGAEFFDLSSWGSLEGVAEVVVEFDVDLVEQVHGAGGLGFHLDSHLRRSDRVAHAVPRQLEPMRAALVAVEGAVVYERTDRFEVVLLDRRCRLGD